MAASCNRLWKADSTGAAKAAIYAAQKVPTWGLFASLRYAMNRGATFAQFHIAERYEERRRQRLRIRNAFGGYLA